jgi:hypothetical protein
MLVSQRVEVVAIFCANATLAIRERSLRGADETGELTMACRQACHKVEAARLVLAELGRRHGPVD